MTKKALKAVDLYMQAHRETPGSDCHTLLLEVFDHAQDEMNAEDRLTFVEWRDKYLASRPHV